MGQAILEYLKAAATVIAAISLYFAYRQLRANVRWNRINATFTYLPETIYVERERAAAAALHPLGIDLYMQRTPLSEAIANAIMKDSALFGNVKDFINLFETYAAAYKAKAIDLDHSYLLNASQLIRYYEVFKPLIDALRSQRQNDMYWAEFEGLVTRDWSPRRQKEIEIAQKAREKRRTGPKYP